MTLPQRQIVAVGLTSIVGLGLVLVAGHRGEHAVRNLIAPGAGLVEESWWLGGLFFVAFVLACVLWVNWGADWLVAAVLAGSIVVSLVVAPNAHISGAQAGDAQRAAHEFPIVFLLFGLWQWLRGLPLISRISRRQRTSLNGLRDLARLGPVNRCRAVSVLSLSGPVPGSLAATIEHDDVHRRARRVALVSRWRRGPAAYGRDQAAVRTARVATISPKADTNGLRSDAAHQVVGAPASEPGWIRLLDATLAAAVLQDAAGPAAASAWRTALRGPFSLRRGHRPGAYWTPLAVPLGRATEWEHVAASGIARASGWIDDSEWHALRQRVLGAAARGPRSPADERTIAGGRVWLTSVDDPEADRILARVTIRRDPLACALDELARSRRADTNHRGSSDPDRVDPDRVDPDFLGAKPLGADPVEVRPLTVRPTEGTIA